MKLSFASTAIVALALATGSAHAATMFGLNDAGGIYSIDTQTGASSLYRTTVANPNGQLNALSYNQFSDTFYYVTQGNRQVVAASPAGNTVIATLPSGSYADAAFWNDSIWTVRDGAGKLVRVDLSGVSPVIKEYSLTGIGTPSFGDISINSAGLLTGAAANNFFTVSLGGITPTTTSVAGTTLSTNMINLQLGLSGGVLFGIETDTDKIFSVNTSTGVRTQVSTLTTTALKINDAAAYIPEASAAMPMLGVAGLLASRRRRRA